MALGIARNGIVRRHEDGSTTITRPGKNGGAPVEIAVPDSLADEYRLATGDVVGGETEALLEDLPGGSDDDGELPPDWDTQYDEPAAARGPVRPPVVFNWGPTVRLTSVTAINGLSPDEALDRPSPRSKRSQSERVPPDLRIEFGGGPSDCTGRMLDFAAPLGAGQFGLVYGPHGGGLTRTLQAALLGTTRSAPDCVPIVLLLRPRAEEATDWRMRAPNADIVVASAAASDTRPEECLNLCDLVLEAAQRQTELGRDVVLLVDSLTALWATMLEAVEADAQQEADTSTARQRIREWAQRAGCFHGEGPLGGGLGGSLTILGSVWHQGIDIEAEEERDTHPHLRLLEHLLPEATWLTALSEPLKGRRLFPAIDVPRCRSQFEERLTPPDLLEDLLRARGGLPRKEPLKAHLRLMEALDASTDSRELVRRLAKLNSAADADAGESRAPLPF